VFRRFLASGFQNQLKKHGPKNRDLAYKTTNRPPSSVLHLLWGATLALAVQAAIFKRPARLTRATLRGAVVLRAFHDGLIWLFSFTCISLRTIPAVELEANRGPARAAVRALLLHPGVDGVWAEWPFDAPPTGPKEALPTRSN
jgi:hypothetical protein